MVTLNQGIRLIPLPDDVLDALPAAPTSDLETKTLTHLTAPLAALITHLSQAERVAYVEADYFGGTGTQVAAVWDGGRLIWGPEQGKIGPINHALRLLGVRRVPGQDEFEAAGLNRHRHLDDWLA
ncbi:hypothetical protein GCM10010842_29970 [Deinococcus daejeonensis]|uniref:Uncharacterized protein n=1 Tax=Deinococcus daejeonensis TaxID=1007098 RepID=A0ABQ2JB45_9DEIO|nr:hypothetical protein GCM10010842_29970 [Deinococcus daejeonensis]